MTLIAIIFPWVSFFLRGKIFSGIICLILQVTLVGWLHASIWAIISLQNKRADRRTEKMIEAMNSKSA